MQNGIDKAIKIAGSQSALARVLGISPQALGKQIKNGNILPKHCLAIEKNFAGQIDRYELNPAHFGERLTTTNCVVIVLQNRSTRTII